MENQSKKLRLDAIKVESFVTSHFAKFDTRTPKGGGSYQYPGNSDLPTDDGTTGDYCPCSNEPIQPFGCQAFSNTVGYCNCLPPVVVVPTDTRQVPCATTQLVCQFPCNGGGGGAFPGGGGTGSGGWHCECPTPIGH